MSKSVKQNLRGKFVWKIVVPQVNQSELVIAGTAAEAIERYIELMTTQLPTLPRSHFEPIGVTYVGRLVG